MKRTLRLALVAIVAAGCTTSPEIADSRPTQAASLDEAASTRAEPDPAVIAARTENPERTAVVEARRAAQQAWTEAVAPPEVDPEHPALRETHSGPALLHVIGHAIQEHEYLASRRYLPDSNVTVQSATFPDDTTAWLETCVVRDVERLNRSGEVMPEQSGSGTSTAQLTEVMRKEDGRWRLAESITNTVDDGMTDCERSGGSGTAGDDVYSDAITSAREASEQALVDLLVASHLDGEELSSTHTGHLLRIYADIATRTGTGYHHASSTRCVPYPGLQGAPPVHEYGEDLYSLFDEYWEEEWGETDPDYGAVPLRCQRRNETSRPLPGRYDPKSRSEIIVNSITMQDVDDPSVAYMDTCRAHELDSPRTRYNLVSPAVVHATESMRLEDGLWKLANRWDVSIDDDPKASCDEAG